MAAEGDGSVANVAGAGELDAVFCGFDGDLRKDISAGNDVHSACCAERDQPYLIPIKPSDPYRSSGIPPKAW